MAAPPKRRVIQARLQRSLHLLHPIICAIHCYCRHTRSYPFDGSNGVCSTRGQRQLDSDGNRGDVGEIGFSVGGVVECITGDPGGIASIAPKWDRVIQLHGVGEQWLQI
jgi:hypothetical protein